MLQNRIIETLPHPLVRAHQLQQHIKMLKDQIASAETEFMQIVLYCKEMEFRTDGNLSLIFKPRTVHHVEPERFAALFPEANQILLQQEIMYLRNEADELQRDGVLKKINKEDAEKHVGKQALLKACIAKTTETPIVVVNPGK